MAYAYLFKYIIIGDTGEKKSKGGKEPLRNGEARPEGQARLRNARLGCSISAVLAAPTW